MLNLGYCCINETLRRTKSPVTTNRKLIRRTFSYEGAAKLALLNATDLLTILRWNEANGIRVFRISSEMMPRSSDPQVSYAIARLSTAQAVLEALREVGNYAAAANHALSFHPGAFVCLGSPNEAVRTLGVLALERENEVADAICSDARLDIPLNFHVGGSYDRDFQATADRFLATFDRLSPSLKARVVLENDDKANCWSTHLLHEFIYKRSGIPITFDFHHYLFCNSSHLGLTLRDEFNLAYSTWNGRSMQVHYSQSPTGEKLIPAHGEFYRDPLPMWIHEYPTLHIHLESKAKELSLIKYRTDFEKGT